MGTPLRKTRLVANDLQRPAFSMPAAAGKASLPMRSSPVQIAPRVVRYVRLAPTPPRRNFSWMAAFAVTLLALTIFMLGVIAGTMFWFTYDSMNNGAVFGPSTVMPRLIEAPIKQEIASPQLVQESQIQDTPHADIVLPADDFPPDSSPEPKHADVAVAPESISGMNLVIHQSKSADTDILLEKARSRLEQGNSDVALVLYERILADEPDNHAALKGKVYALAHSGKYAASVAILRNLLKSNPQDTDVRASLAAILGASTAPEALAELNGMAETNPRDTAIQIALAKGLARRGDVKEAIPHLDRALRLAPKDVTSRFDLAVLYDRAEQEPQALALYRQILQLVREGNAEVPTDTLDAVRQRAAYLETIYNHE